MGSSLDNLSLNECREILKKKLKTSNFEVKSYKICPLNERKGFLGDYFYLFIDYKHENKEESERFFVKVKSTSGIQLDFLNENRLFLKECKFYQKLVRDMLENGVVILNGCVPACYYVSNDQYLIFEDLSKRGYINLNARLCSRLDYVRSSLDTLAKLHCSGFIFEEKMKRKYGENFKLPQNYAEVFAESFFSRTKISKRLVKAAKAGTAAQIDLHFQNTDIDIQRFKTVANDTYDSFFEIVKPSTVYRNTMCHCDLWATNFMCKFENDQAVHSYLVDFQMVRYGPPAQDFIVFLYLTTDAKFRQDHLKELMEYYYNKLSEILKEYSLCPTNILSYEDFVESCNYYKVFACALAVNHHQMTMISEEIIGELLESGFMEKLVLDGRPEVINEYWYKDDFYQNKMIENIMEFREILIKNKQL